MQIKIKLKFNLYKFEIEIYAAFRTAPRPGGHGYGKRDSSGSARPLPGAGRRCRPFPRRRSVRPRGVHARRENCAKVASSLGFRTKCERSWGAPLAMGKPMNTDGNRKGHTAFMAALHHQISSYRDDAIQCGREGRHIRVCAERSQCALEGADGVSVRGLHRRACRLDRLGWALVWDACFPPPGRCAAFVQTTRRILSVFGQWWIRKSGRSF